MVNKLAAKRNRSAPVGSDGGSINNDTHFVHLSRVKQAVANAAQYGIDKDELIKELKWTGNIGHSGSDQDNKLSFSALTHNLRNENGELFIFELVWIPADEINDRTAISDANPRTIEIVDSNDVDNIMNTFTDTDGVNQPPIGYMEGGVIQLVDGLHRTTASAKDGRHPLPVLVTKEKITRKSFAAYDKNTEVKLARNAYDNAVYLRKLKDDLACTVPELAEFVGQGERGVYDALSYSKLDVGYIKELPYPAVVSVTILHALYKQTKTFDSKQREAFTGALIDATYALRGQMELARTTHVSGESYLNAKRVLNNKAVTIAKEAFHELNNKVEGNDDAPSIKYKGGTVTVNTNKKGSISVSMKGIKKEDEAELKHLVSSTLTNLLEGK